MLRGPLLLLLIFGAALATRLAPLRRSGPSAQGVVVGGLTLLATLWIRSIRELWQALPEFRAHTATRMDLDVGGRRSRLDGLPRRSRWADESLARGGVRANAPAHLAAARWQIDRGPSLPATAAFASMLAGDMPASRRRDIIDGLALEFLAFEPGRTPAETLEQTLAVRAWPFGVQRVEPGAAATVSGTGRTGLPRVDIGLSLADALHAIPPGGAPEVARRERTNAPGAGVVLGLPTIAGHLLAYLDCSVYWRALPDSFRNNAS